MRAMVDNGEVDALVPERVWQEFSKGLMEVRPSRMIEILRECGALSRLLSMLASVWAMGDHEHVNPVLASLDVAAAAHASLPVRLAVLMQAATLGSGDLAAIEAACARLKVPGDCRDLALMTGRERDAIQAGATTAQVTVALFERCDAFRKPSRFAQMLEAVAYVGRMAGRVIAATHWQMLLATARGVDAGALAAAVAQAFPGQPQRINDAIRAARVTAVDARLNT